MYKKFIIGVFLISGIFLSNSPCEEQNGILVNLEKSIINNELTTKICIKNNREEQVRIILKTIAEKKGKAGKSKINQFNYVSLEAYEERCLSRVALSLESGEGYYLVIEAYEDKKLIVKKSIMEGN